MAGALDTEKKGNKAQTPVSEGLFRAEAIEAARNRLGLPVNDFGLKSWVLVGLMDAFTARIGDQVQAQQNLGPIMPYWQINNNIIISNNRNLR
jgi:hypothetical protein